MTNFYNILHYLPENPYQLTGFFLWLLFEHGMSLTVFGSSIGLVYAMIKRLWIKLFSPK